MLLAFTAASPSVAPVQLAVPQGHFCRATAQAVSAQRGLFLAIPGKN